MIWAITYLSQNFGNNYTICANKLRIKQKVTIIIVNVMKAEAG